MSPLKFIFFAFSLLPATILSAHTPRTLLNQLIGMRRAVTIRLKMVPIALYMNRTVTTLLNRFGIFSQEVGLPLNRRKKLHSGWSLSTCSDIQPTFSLRL